MKRSFAAGLAALALFGCATAGEPGDATSSNSPYTPITDGDVTEGHVDGMLVLVKHVPTAELASGTLVIRGGVRNWDATSSGVESLAMDVAAGGGTTTLDKDAFARRLAQLGASLSGRTGNEASDLSFKSLTESWDGTFDLAADAFLHPALPADEIEVDRQRTLSMLRHEQETPDGKLRLVALHQVFHGHPYENRPVGTMENVTRFQRADLDAQLTKLRERKRLVFIAVGNLDPVHVFDQVHKAFGALPEGTYVDAPLPRIAFDASTVQSEAMKIPTNYIRSVFPAPRWTDPDFAAGAVTMSALGWRLFQEVRTKRNLSYAPGAGMDLSHQVGVGILSVTAVEPTKTEQVMMDEVKKLQNEPMDAKDLAGSKSTFLTGYLMGSDTVDGQAGLLQIALIVGGDWRLSRTFAEKVKQVTPADVQAFAHKIVHLQTAVVGDASKLDSSILL